MIKKDKIKKYFYNILGILFLFGIFMPTSVKPFTLNPNMRYFCFLFLDFLGLIVLLYEKKFSIKSFFICISILIVLIFFTIIGSLYYDLYIKTYGNLLLYGTSMICYSICFNKISANKFWDILFMIAMTIIVVFVIGNIFNINILNNILKTYFVDHVAYMLDVMISKNKPVTFFTSHSMAAFIYTLFIIILFYRNEKFKNSIFNYIYIICFIIGLIFLKSNSSYMMIVLLYFLYIKYINREKHNVKKTIILGLTLLVTIVFVANNHNSILNIISSNDNGLIGRYSTVGTLSNDINFIKTFNVPTGLNDIYYQTGWLKYRDSIYLVNMMRGGIVLVLLYIYLIINFYKVNILDRNMSKVLILLTLLFDIGYTFSWEQRFITVVLFVVPYINYIYSQNDPIINNNNVEEI